nr:sulfonate ABC transporter substrate-binding protein [Alicyclobacillus shizuokensis]
MIRRKARFGIPHHGWRLGIGARGAVKRFAAALSVLGLCAVVSACGTAGGNEQAGGTTSNSGAGTGGVVHIGYQKYGTLNILKARGTLDKDLKKIGYRVDWTEFPGGPQLLEAMRSGSIDIGHAGEAPPVFAQAGDVSLVYLAHEPASPHNEAILVPKGSPIHTLAQLKGKKIALNKGSNVHYLLVKLLQRAGLKYSDIQPVYLAPDEARAAFQRGSVDAWVIWDPYFAVAESQLHARVLADGEGVVQNHEFYLASRTWALQHQAVVKVFLRDLSETDAWAKTHRAAVARLLAPQLGIDEKTLLVAANRRTYGVQPMDKKTVQQQDIADTFYRLGLIPKSIHVAQDVLPQNGG